MSLESHPFADVQYLLRKHGVLDSSMYISHGRVRLSYYSPRPGYGEYQVGYTPYQACFNEKYVDYCLFNDSDKPRREVGICSTVEQRSHPYNMHLGFVDCVTTDLKKIRSYFDCDLLRRYRPLSVYKTDRSFHVYYTGGLLSQDQWLQFLGELLIAADDRDDEDVVDIRWIAHTLRRGFGVLRWSANDKTLYTHRPTLVEKIQAEDLAQAVGAPAAFL